MYIAFCNILCRH